MRRRTSTVSLTASTPSARMVPEVGVSRLSRQRTKVVLPTPFGPITPKTEPVGMRKETPFRATFRPKRLVR